MKTLLYGHFPHDPKRGCSETPMNRGFQTPCKEYHQGSCKGYLDGSCMGYDSPPLYPLGKLLYTTCFVDIYNQKGESMLADAGSFLADALKPA